MGLCASTPVQDDKPADKVQKRSLVSQLSGGRSQSLAQALSGGNRQPAWLEVQQQTQPTQKAAVPVSALSDVLATLVLPKLHLQDLKTLSHTSCALRAAVDSMPEAQWRAAAARSLPPKHPVLTNPRKETIVEYGRIHATLRSGKKPSLEYVPGSKAIVSAISPDDRMLAIISRDGLLRFWDLQTRELVRITKATVLQFTGVELTWAPDSTQILMVTVGSPRCVLVRSDKALVIMRQLVPGQGQIHRVLWAPDSQAIACLLGMHDTARLLVIDTRLEPIWQSAQEPIRAAWAPDSSCLAYTAHSNGRSELLMYERGGHPEAYWFERDDGAASDVPDTPCIQQVRSLSNVWQEECTAPDHTRLLAVDWSGRGGILLLAQSGRMIVQRLPEGPHLVIHTMLSPSPADTCGGAAPTFAEWSPCGDKCCVVRAAIAGCELCMFCATSGQALFSQSLGFPSPLYWTVFWRSPQTSKYCVSPDGKHLAVLDKTQSLRILNAATGAVQLRRDSERNALEITSLRWNTWGSQLYLQSEESSIQIYTFYSPKKPARPSMSHRLLGAAASALSVPRPE